MKRAYSGEKEEDFSVGKVARTEVVEKFCCKILCSDCVTSAVIGTRGDVITGIQNDTGVLISMSGRGDFFPGTHMRLIRIRAENPESIEMAVNCIVDIFAENAKILVAKGETNTVDLCNKEGTEIKISLVVPSCVVSAVIGNGGEKITEMRNRLPCKIRCESEKYGGVTDVCEQFISILGETESVLDAVREILEVICSHQEESWFPHWVKQACTSVGKGSSLTTSKKGKGGKDAYENKGKDGKRGKDRGSDSYSRYEVGKTSPVNDRPYNPFVAALGKGMLSPSAAQSSREAALVKKAADSLSHDVKQDERGFQCQTTIRTALVSSVIGSRGSGIQEIENKTGCKIRIRGQDDDPEFSTATIIGPVCSVASAYMYLIDRYVGLEKQSASKGVSGGGGGELEDSYAIMQEELQRARDKLRRLERR